MAEKHRPWQPEALRIAAGLALVACVAFLVLRSAGPLPLGRLADALDGGGSSLSAAPRFAAVQFHTNHKTGTVQASCVAWSIRHVTGVRVWRHEGNATSYEMEAALAGMDTQPLVRPAIAKVINPMKQECFWGDPGNKDPEAGFRCPQPEVPCNASGAPQLSLDGCLVRLPLSAQGALGLVHFIRDPWATVVSAYNYHVQDPRPEPWLDAKFSDMLQLMGRQGVPLQRVAALGLALDPAQHEGRSYAEVLRALPPERGVQLEFWRSSPYLYAMARQDRLFEASGLVSMRVRAEDAAADFDGTWRRVLHRFYPQDAEAVLQEAQDCNPANWDAADLANSNHVTGAKHSSQDKARLMRVLAAQPDVRLHLCRVSWALGYQPEPCRPKGRR